MNGLYSDASKLIRCTEICQVNEKRVQRCDPRVRSNKLESKSRVRYKPKDANVRMEHESRSVEPIAMQS